MEPTRLDCRVFVGLLFLAISFEFFFTGGMAGYMAGAALLSISLIQLREGIGRLHERLNRQEVGDFL